MSMCNYHCGNQGSCFDHSQLLSLLEQLRRRLKSTVKDFSRSCGPTNLAQPQSSDSIGLTQVFRSIYF
ncbi:hypothetical protein I79_014701 [Cricetulus griseus]|uniref:Uncharacterized protein n=1 Tax=Cricetulus griseus TaxID=10029 RepID=G3HUT5_CRIGR|nr:hypothetical protein I79_014701 [Cricetulus griseus]